MEGTRVSKKSKLELENRCGSTQENDEEISDDQDYIESVSSKGYFLNQHEETRLQIKQRRAARQKGTKKSKSKLRGVKKEVLREKILESLQKLKDSATIFAISLPDLFEYAFPEAQPSSCAFYSVISSEKKKTAPAFSPVASIKGRINCFLYALSQGVDQKQLIEYIESQGATALAPKPPVVKKETKRKSTEKKKNTSFEETEDKETQNATTYNPTDPESIIERTLLNLRENHGIYAFTRYEAERSVMRVPQFEGHKFKVSNGTLRFAGHCIKNNQPELLYTLRNGFDRESVKDYIESRYDESYPFQRPKRTVPKDTLVELEQLAPDNLSDSDSEEDNHEDLHEEDEEEELDIETIIDEGEDKDDDEDPIVSVDVSNSPVKGRASSLLAIKATHNHKSVKLPPSLPVKPVTEVVSKAQGYRPCVKPHGLPKADIPRVVPGYDGVTLASRSIQINAPSVEKNPAPAATRTPVTTLRQPLQFKYDRALKFPKPTLPSPREATSIPLTPLPPTVSPSKNIPMNPGMVYFPITQPNRPGVKYYLVQNTSQHLMPVPVPSSNFVYFFPPKPQELERPQALTVSSLEPPSLPLVLSELNNSPVKKQKEVDQKETVVDLCSQEEKVVIEGEGDGDVVNISQFVGPKRPLPALNLEGSPVLVRSRSVSPGELELCVGENGVLDLDFEDSNAKTTIPTTTVTRTTAEQESEDEKPVQIFGVDVTQPPSSLWKKVVENVKDSLSAWFG